MKKYILLIMTAFIVFSCGNNEVKNESLEVLKQQRANLTKKIDSLHQELKLVEANISKLDTGKKLQIVTALPVKKDVFKHYVEIQGVVNADKNIEIRPELGGIIKSVFVKVGDKVNAGQTLVQLDDATIKNNIAQLTTQLNLAKTTFERQERLWNQKIGSEMQYLQAKANKESLENNLKVLKSQAQKMKIVAPFNGVIDDIFPKKGELTSPQTPIIRLINLDQVYIEAEVTETFLPIIKVGTEVLLNFPSINLDLNSKISQKGNFINPENRSFKTRININNGNHQLKPNLLANVKIEDFKQDGIIIPAYLVQQDQQGNNYVFVLKEENDQQKVQKNYISILKEYKQEILIGDGLSEGDILVNEGARIVKDGDLVKVSDQTNS